MKYLFYRLFGNIVLLNDPIKNLIIVAIMGKIAFLKAYKIVGSFYAMDMIDGSIAGRVMHWIIRGAILGVEILLVRGIIGMLDYVK